MPLLLICLLIISSGIGTILSQSPKPIRIPSIPHDHLLCWFRNLPKIVQQQLHQFCNDAQYTNFNIEDWKEVVNLNEAQELNLKQNFCQKIQFQLEQHNFAPCWGYENDATQDCLLYKPECLGSAQSWASDKREQMKIFFDTADFGYVRERQNELEYFCKPNSASETNSQLKCTKFLRYCAGKNIYINFNRLTTLEEPIRYRDDVLEYGNIGGWNCTLDRPKLMNEGHHKSPLMSWFAEISNFKALTDEISTKCDITIEKPTFIMKLDATVNMYHHFCDFVNLYTSLHLNGSQFSLDNYILVWDTFPYRSNFAPVWKAFTQNQILNLNDFKGKEVCFKDVMFPFLPRMIFGLYYNMPLIPGCDQSGLFRAFNRHLLYHLGLSSSEDMRQDETIRITFISRKTKYRRVLNQDQLISSLRQTLDNKGEHKVEIGIVDFNHHMPFMHQIEISSRSDILIGMHGAGLTHTLLQPDYGVLFELFNCQDADCYKDLSRLRGTHYLTWRNESKLSSIEEDNSQAADRKTLGAAHAKFVNYRFDTNEFVDIVTEAIDLVRMRKKTFCEHYHNGLSSINVNLDRSIMQERNVDKKQNKNKESNTASMAPHKIEL